MGFLGSGFRVTSTSYKKTWSSEFDEISEKWDLEISRVLEIGYMLFRIRLLLEFMHVKKEYTKVKILELLKITFRITLTRSLNNLILSKNHMNVFTIGMTKTLYISGVGIRKVGFFGMKMSIGIAKFLIDNSVQHYLEFLTPELESRVSHNKSVFDIEIGDQTNKDVPKIDTCHIICHCKRPP